MDEHGDAKRERAREYQRRWRQAHPDYARVWRAAHADAERDRRRRYRETHRDIMRAQYARRRHRLGRVVVAPIPESHTGHDLFATAERILQRIGVTRDRSLIWIHDPLWEDAASEVVLALLEGRSPVAAAYTYVSAERLYRKTHLQLFTGE